MAKFWRSQRGMTITELLIGMAVFSTILAISLGLITRWMNISRLSDLQAQAVGNGRKAIVTMANDIRRAELIMTNAKLSMKYAVYSGAAFTLAATPAPPYPSFGDYVSTPIPLVVIQSPEAAVAPPAAFVMGSPLLTNNIALVYTDTLNGLTVKGYIVYYAGVYTVDGVKKVGLFRYQWIDNSSKYKFSQVSMKLNALTTASISTVVLGVKTDASPEPKAPKLELMVPALHFAHAPGYKPNVSFWGKTSPVATKNMFKIYNLHPYSKETWMSPFYVDINFSVVSPLHNAKELEQLDEKKLHKTTLRTVAYAKNVYLPLRFGDSAK